MSFGPIQKISTDFEDYPGYWLKGYEQGTTTPIIMAIDVAGSTTLAKAEISSGGTVPIGFIKTVGDVIFQPHFDAIYDLWLFPTEAEADANDTSNAIQLADNINPANDSSSIEYRANTTVGEFLDNSTVDDYSQLRLIASLELDDGDVITVTKNGISGQFAVRTGSVSDNGGTFFVFTDDSNRYAERLYKGRPLVTWWGCLNDGDRSNPQTAEIQAAFDNAAQLDWPPGRYVIDDTLTKDAHSFKCFGDAEGDNGAEIIPASVWVGSTVDSDGYLVFISLGNGSISRYFNEMRNITFYDPDESDTYCALYFNRVNNQSKIFNCEFERMGRGFEVINLALGNVISFNKFHRCTDHFRLTDTAGNSTLITHNYLSQGRSYFNNSMTAVTYTHNICDGQFSLYTDGTSGPRGCFISLNRFETADATGDPALSFGVVRGMQVTNNYFTGQGNREVAIQFRSAGARESAVVTTNHFEDYSDHFVTSILPDGGLTLHSNTTDPGTTTNDITAVTQANPAVVTYSGLDNFADGDLISIDIVRGMSELNGNTFTVANVNTTAGTFELSGTDSTSFKAYTSGGLTQYPAIPFETNRLAYGFGKEGTWVPEIQDASGNVGSAATIEGSYQLNTNWVTISCQLSDIDTSGLTAGDQFRVYGIPWDVSNSAGDPGLFIGQIRCQFVGFTGQIIPVGTDGAAYIMFSDMITAATDDDIIVSDLTSGPADIFFSITYKIKA